jgi:hypothetical protein
MVGVSWKEYVYEDRISHKFLAMMVVRTGFNYSREKENKGMSWNHFAQSF